MRIVEFQPGESYYWKVNINSLLWMHNALVLDKISYDTWTNKKFQNDKLEGSNYILVSLYINTNNNNRHWGYMPCNDIGFHFYASRFYTYLGEIDIVTERKNKLKKLNSL